VTTLYFKHYLVVDKTDEEAQEIFYRAIAHLLVLKPVFQSSYFNNVTKQINIAFSDLEAMNSCSHRLSSFAEVDSLVEDTQDLGVNIESDILDRISRDPAEEKTRSLYFSPLSLHLKESELDLNKADVEDAFTQVFTDTPEVLTYLNLETTTIRNYKGYSRITFPDREFLINSGNFFTEDRRIFTLKNEIYQIVVPKDNGTVELYFGGWKQRNLTPKEIADFLSSIPHFPQIVSVACPKDKRTGRFNPFYCFVTVRTENADYIKQMKIRSGGKFLRIAIAKKREPIASY